MKNSLEHEVNELVVTFDEKMCNGGPSIKKSLIPYVINAAHLACRDTLFTITTSAALLHR